MVKTGASPGTRLTGVPSLIAFARVVRLQKCEMTFQSRMNMAVSTYSLIRAKFKDHKDKEVKDLISDIGKDIVDCRKEFEKSMDDNLITPDEASRMNLILDGLEYRLDDVMVKTKAIDSAALQEMVVPE